MGVRGRISADLLASLGAQGGGAARALWQHQVLRGEGGADFPISPQPATRTRDCDRCMAHGFSVPSDSGHFLLGDLETLTGGHWPPGLHLQVPAVVCGARAAWEENLWPKGLSH